MKSRLNYLYNGVTGWERGRKTGKFWSGRKMCSSSLYMVYIICAIHSFYSTGLCQPLFICIMSHSILEYTRIVFYHSPVQNIDVELSFSTSDHWEETGSQPQPRLSRGWDALSVPGTQVNGMSSWCTKDWLTISFCWSPSVLLLYSAEITLNVCKNRCLFYNWLMVILFFF